jgi:hypothetical protein
MLCLMWKYETVELKSLVTASWKDISESELSFLNHRIEGSRVRARASQPHFFLWSLCGDCCCIAS